jgi:hypothetical protein
MNLAIPIHGKMATRTFYCPEFISALKINSVEPIYFLSPHYFEQSSDLLDGFKKLDIDAYDNFRNNSALLRILEDTRRYIVRTETTDLRFRQMMEMHLFSKRSVYKNLRAFAFNDMLRNMPSGFGKVLRRIEEIFYKTDAHMGDLYNRGIAAVLIPGTGTYGFRNECLFAREARRIGIPIYSAVTNYDNIVNRGFPGIVPEKLAVWSQKMADQAISLHKIPSKKIEITGPVQYDRYFRKPDISRKEFLINKNLDYQKKTILFAGGVNITRYFEIYNLLVVNPEFDNCNMIFRVYPHKKLLGAPGWKVLKRLLDEQENVYISDPFTESSDSMGISDLRRDILEKDTEMDELHYLFYYSDVMINIFSTISLEAAICDLPVIHMGYDIYDYGTQYRIMTEFQQRQTHNKDKLRLAAARVAKSEDELMSFLRMYLDDKSIDKDNRYEYALSECEWFDGKASERLVKIIHNSVDES